MELAEEKVLGVREDARGEDFERGYTAGKQGAGGICMSGGIGEGGWWCI